MQGIKIINKKAIEYVKQNRNYLVALIYIIVVSAYSSRLIFKYGETNFYISFIFGWLVLIIFLKIFSEKKT